MTVEKVTPVDPELISLGIMRRMFAKSTHPIGLGHHYLDAHRRDSVFRKRSNSSRVDLEGRVLHPP